MATTDIDPADYRQVLGHLPTGVAVVTAVADAAPVGMAVGSLTSVSLDPMLVGFFAGHSSSSWPKIRTAGSFCANVLSEDQADLCRTFAGSGRDRFAGLEWMNASSRSPLLPGVAAWIDCDIADVISIGDHDLVVGEVRDLGSAPGKRPLLFHRGGYVGLQ